MPLTLPNGFHGLVTNLICDIRQHDIHQGHNIRMLEDALMLMMGELRIVTKPTAAGGGRLTEKSPRSGEVVTVTAWQ